MVIEPSPTLASARAVAHHRLINTAPFPADLQNRHALRPEHRRRVEHEFAIEWEHRLAGPGRPYCAQADRKNETAGEAPAQPSHHHSRQCSARKARLDGRAAGI